MDIEAWLRLDETSPEGFVIKVAQDGILLTEAQIAAIEKAKARRLHRPALQPWLAQSTDRRTGDTAILWLDGYYSWPLRAHRVACRLGADSEPRDRRDLCDQC